MLLEQILELESQILQSVLILAYIMYLIGMNLVILFDNKPVQSTMAWLLTVNLLPFLGLPIYILAGINWRHYRIVSQRPEEIFQRYLRQDSPEPIVSIEMPAAKKLIQLLHSTNGSRVTCQNKVDFYHQGQSFFEALKADLQSAQQFIHMEFFIWRSDALGQELAEILIQKAQAGVKVRILVDRIGCFGRISYAYRQAFKAAGVEFYYFMAPLTPLTSLLSNYLNHRKIVVIDGQISYLGGMNIGMEYITGGSKFPAWRDTQLRLVGEASSQLHTIFVTDWFNTTREWIDQESDYFRQWDTVMEPQDLAVQIACSGPDSDWHTIHNVYYTMIADAREQICLQSPYFIPDELLLNALILAALSGVEVNIMMAGIPDKKVPFWVAHTYFADLLKAGANIYQYQDGFLHSKLLIADHYVATVGTSNFDIRAFKLDYEVNALFYDAHTVTLLKSQFQEDLSHCRQITLQDIHKQTPLERFRNLILRLFSPLL